MKWGSSTQSLYFNSLAVRPLVPVALPFLSFEIADLTSSTVGGISSTTILSSGRMCGWLCGSETSGGVGT